MLQNKNLAYQAKKLATNAAIVTDNLVTQIETLPEQYRSLLQTEKLRTATSATTAALTEYEANFDYKTTLAATAERNLKDAVTKAKAAHAQKQTELKAERATLKAKWLADSAALSVRETELTAAQKTELSAIVTAGKTAVTQSLTEAKSFGDKLATAYSALRSIYVEYTNLVQAVDASLPEVNLARAILPRSAPRTAKRTSATTVTAATPIEATASV